jgi:hypothetical protein
MGKIRVRRALGLARCALLPALIALAMPAGAHAAWSAPITLSDPGAGRHASYPEVAVDPDGDAVFVWQRLDGTMDCGVGSPRSCSRIEARARSSSGVLSAVQTLTAPAHDAYYPKLGVDPSGTAIFTWQELYSRTRARSADGTLTPVQVLTTGGRPQVAVDQNGTAVYTWLRRDDTTDCNGGGCYRAQTRTRSAAGVLGPIQTLSPGGRNAFNPQVGVDQNGNAVFVWGRNDMTADCPSYPPPDGCARIQARSLSAAGVLGPVHTLSAPGQDAGRDFDIAVAPSGDAIFAWFRPDGTTTCGTPACPRVQTRVLSATGTLGTTQTVSPAAQTGYDPHVGVDQSGNAVFIWQYNDNTTDCFGSYCYRIATRARSAAGTLSPAQTLSPPAQIAGLSQIAVDQAGDAVIAWQSRDGTTSCTSSGCYRIRVRTRSSAGALSAMETLSEAGRNAIDARLAYNNGHAMVAWRRSDGSSFRIQAATGP